MTFVSQNSIFNSTISTFLANGSVLNTRIIALIHIFLLGCFLSIGFYYKIYKWFRLGINKLDLLLLCCAFSGIIIWNFTEAPGRSHYTFLHYPQITFMIFGATGTYLLFKDLFLKKTGLLYTLALISLAFIPVKGYEIYNWATTGFNFRKLSFLSLPNCSDFPKGTMEKLSQISNNNENNILINILPKNAMYPASQVMNMHVRRSYQSWALDYIRLGWVRDPESLKRLFQLRDKFDKITKRKIFTQDDMDDFKILFPGKQLFFIFFDHQIPFDTKLQEQIISEIPGNPGMKILKSN